MWLPKDLNCTLRLDQHLPAANTVAMQEPHELSRKTLATGQFLNLQAIRWRTAAGVDHLWEMAARNGTNRAVLAIAWLVPSQRLVLIRQYRPPAGGNVIEFPAGLIDEGESPGAAVLRELREETGYHARVVRLFDAAYNSPGLSSERTHVVLAEIDETLAENQQPQPRPEIGEDISVVLVARAGLTEFLAREEAAGTQFDSKVFSYLAGL